MMKDNTTHVTEGADLPPIADTTAEHVVQRRTVGQTGPCADCGSIDWKQDDNRGEVSCNACGLVVEDNIIDMGAEWTNYSDGNERSRVGAPSTLTLADKGLSTDIGPATRDYSGASLSTRSKRDWRRRGRMDNWSKNRNGQQRNLVDAMVLIRQHSGLTPQNLQIVASYYRKALEKNLVLGRSIRGIAAACTYHGYKAARIPRTIEEIAESYDMTKEIELKELKRAIRLVSRELNLHTITDPSEYLDKMGSDLKLPPSVIGQAFQLWQVVGQYDDWQGKKPSGVAGILLYSVSQMSGHSRTQREVCDVSGISEVTLRGLKHILNELIELSGFDPSKMN